MPAKAPTPCLTARTRLAEIGRRIRECRKALRISVETTAEAAGMSRVTLHRIERGEPSVTIGAYLNATAALGLELGVFAPCLCVAGTAGRAAFAASSEPAPGRIALAEYPQLQQLAWSIPGVKDLSPAEALGLYERSWRHVDVAQLEPRERELIAALVGSEGHGHLLV